MKKFKVGDTVKINNTVPKDYCKWVGFSGKIIEILQSQYPILVKIFKDEKPKLFHLKETEIDLTISKNRFENIKKVSK